MFSKKTFLLLFLLFIVIATISSVSADDVNDDIMADSSDDIIEVQQNDDVISEEISEDDSNQLFKAESDDEPVLGDGVLSFQQLQGQINSVFEGGTLTLNNDYAWDSSFGGNAVFIEKAITINGNGHTIDGGKAVRAFYIPANGVVLNDITFTNCYADSSVGGGYGGCLYLINNLTTIKKCNFVNCNATTSGGAIVTNGELIIDDCFFWNNTAQEDGGAIFAFYPSTGYKSLTVTNSIFSENWAERYGGAIYLNYYTSKNLATSPAAKTSIKNTIFSKNEALYGGAIFNYQDVDALSCMFLSNFAYYSGGAIFMSNGGYWAEDLSQTFRLVIHGSSLFNDNFANDEGGAIRISAGADALQYGIKGILRVYDNTIFSENYADYGGALSLVDCDALVENAKFKDNEAYYEGSAMYGGTAIKCTFEGNTDPATYNTEVTNKLKVKLTAKQSGSYYKGKTITVTLTDLVSNAALANKKIVVKFSNGKTITAKTNSKGVATIEVPYAPKTYTATIKVSDSGVTATSVKMTKIKIAKAPTKLTAKKLTAKKGKKKFFKVTVKNKKTKKAIKGVKVKVKVYTGKKAKTYTIKTNAKGIAQLNVKKLKVGSHKVIVSSGNKYCVAKNIKSTIKIKK